MTWYADSQPVESQVQVVPGATLQMRSVLQMRQLGRANHGVRYSCAASNSRIVPALVSSVTVKMRRKLTESRITFTWTYN